MPGAFAPKIEEKPDNDGASSSASTAVKRPRLSAVDVKAEMAQAVDGCLSGAETEVSTGGAATESRGPVAVPLNIKSEFFKHHTTIHVQAELSKADLEDVKKMSPFCKAQYWSRRLCIAMFFLNEGDGRSERQARDLVEKHAKTGDPHLKSKLDELHLTVGLCGKADAMSPMNVD